MREYPERAQAYLEYVRKLPMKLRALKDEQAECEAEMTSIRALDPAREWVSGGGVPQGLDALVVRWEEYSARIKESLCTLSNERQQARELILKVPDPEGQSVLLEYYVVARSEAECLHKLKIAHSWFWRLHNQGMRDFELVYAKFRLSE